MVKLCFPKRPLWGLHLWRVKITDLAQLREELLTYVSNHLWPDPSEAEDFVQRSFERLCKRSGVLNERTLLYKIANALLMNEFRDRGRRPADASLERLAWDGEAFEGLDHLPQFQTYDFEDADFTAEFDRAVRALDPEPRDAFILGELRGLTNREAGAVLNTSHVTARVRRDAATATIREELRQ